MDWLDMLAFYCDALNLRREEILLQAKIAGAKFKR